MGKTTTATIEGNKDVISLFKNQLVSETAFQYCHSAKYTKKMLA